VRQLEDVGGRKQETGDRRQMQKEGERKKNRDRTQDTGHRI
jgi:hypothetical protein